MLWTIFFILAVAILLAAVIIGLWLKKSKKQKGIVTPLNCLLTGCFVSAFLLFIPIYYTDLWKADFTILKALLLSLLDTIKLFTLNVDSTIVTEGVGNAPAWLSEYYSAFAFLLYVFAPIMTFGFLLSFLKNVSAHMAYIFSWRKQIYIFSELNEKSIVLASDIVKNHKKAKVLFGNVFEKNEETAFELVEQARRLGAICFKKDVTAVELNMHSKKQEIHVFLIGETEMENINQALYFIANYKTRKNTLLYLFSTSTEGELLLAGQDKGVLRVRRINEPVAMITRVLYEEGTDIFDSALPVSKTEKQITAVVVGMGNYGTEMLKALSWYCQMDGYKLQLHGFDKDELAKEKFSALCPELMTHGYDITIHDDMDIETKSFAEEIAKLKNATYVFVALGSDSENIKAAVQLRMLFERNGAKPKIHAVVYNSQVKESLSDVTNFSGQAYNIDFTGDVKTSYSEKVIMDFEVEEEALRRHLKWGKEEVFWTYEYNYRSSIASALHMYARIHCGIPGATKATEELTEEERDIIEQLEHRRWNAYMRSEGFIYSGSPSKETRNDLGKMHHNLSDFSELSEEDKRKDSQVGTK